MKLIWRVGVVLGFGMLLAIGIHLRGSQLSIEPAADAAVQRDDDSFALECSLETLKGSYGTSTTGSIVFAGPIGPVADVGVVTFDGNGGASQTSTVSLNGMIIPNRTSLAGSYVVNPDCTGNISLTLPGPAGPIISTSNIVIVNHGKELRTIVTGAGRVLAGTAVRQ